MQLRYLSRQDVMDTGVTMASIMEAVESAFIARYQGEAQAPPKTAIYPHPDGFLNAMPACLPQAAGIKWVSAYTQNACHSLPNIHALIILNDAETGRPLALMDGTWITAMRTGAVTGLCAQLLFSQSQPVAAILGCGVQGRSNLEALMVGSPPGCLWVYDVDQRVLSDYGAEVRRLYPQLEVKEARSPQEAVVAADIVITATKILQTPQPVIDRDWLKPGSLGVPLEYDSYWTTSSINSAERFWVDDLEQLNSLRSHGYFQGVRAPDAELGEVFARESGRGQAQERTLVMSLGLGITDVATAWLIYCQGTELGLGTALSL